MHCTLLYICTVFVHITVQYVFYNIHCLYTLRGSGNLFTHTFCVYNYFKLQQSENILEIRCVGTMQFCVRNYTEICVHKTILGTLCQELYKYCVATWDTIIVLNSKSDFLFQDMLILITSTGIWRLGFISGCLCFFHKEIKHCL